MLEMAFVGAVTEGFVLREPATADADDLASFQAIGCPGPVDYLEISFQL